MNTRTINFPEKDQALSDDVNTLGALVGEVLVEQYGQELYERVESLRVAAIARRESASTDLHSLDEQIDQGQSFDSDPDYLNEARNLIRGFSGYFQVVNLAEKVHRIRRMRDYQKDGTALAGSLRHKLSELRDAGVSDAAVEALLAGLVIEPVMTAHPTEATRRSLLAKERIIVRRLVDRFNPERTPQEERMALERRRVFRFTIQGSLMRISLEPAGRSKVCRSRVTMTSSGSPRRNILSVSAFGTGTRWYSARRLMPAPAARADSNVTSA